MSSNVEQVQRVGKQREAFEDARKPRVHQDRNYVPPALDRLAREEVSKLVQRVFLLPENGARPHVVVFTGFENNDGSSILCARAGEAVAGEVSGKVCLLDANLTSPTLHQLYGLQNLRGLADARREPHSANDFVSQLAASNLWLIPAGLLGREGNRVVCSERFQALVVGLRQQYEYLLINAPPAGLSSEV